MRKLYELELNDEELTALVEALQGIGRWRDNDFRGILVGELLAQHDREEVGMTGILLDYQGGVQTEPEVITDRSIKHYNLPKQANQQNNYPFRSLLERITSHVHRNYHKSGG